MRGTRFLLVLGLLLSPALAADMAAVRALTQAGANDLALRLMERAQPPPTDAAGWMAWERERFAIYRSRSDHAAILRRADTLPADLPPGFVDWAQTEAVHAALALRRTEDARARLRTRLWRAKQVPSLARHWRQLLIQSYLIDDNIDDALRALRRYREEYRENSDDWRVLEAATLLRAQRDAAALDVLAGVDTHEGRLLRLLAQLHTGKVAPVRVMEDATQLAGKLRLKPTLQRQAWLIANEAALRAGNAERRLVALEAAFAIEPAPVYTARLFPANVDDLWQAYEAVARLQAKRQRLVPGADAAWLRHAELIEKRDAVSARAINATLSHAAQAPAVRSEAVQRFLASLATHGMSPLLRPLYLQSSRYAVSSSIPPFVRYQLVDQALAAYDIRLATRLMENLSPPPDEDPVLWQLRRARLHVYADETRQAMDQVAPLLAGKEKLTPAIAGRLIQLVFDLQTAGHHREALTILIPAVGRIGEPRLVREAYYWIADSRSALGDHKDAAEYYLLSAAHPPGDGRDLWGHSARFRAAESLGRAGLIADARSVYQRLLGETSDARQRALIERSVQQLWLMEKPVTTP